jgi:hypothetical protein
MKRALSRQYTEIEATKTIAEIQQMLSEAGAEAVLLEYKDRRAVAVSFRIQSEYGLISFQLPARVEQATRLMTRNRRIRNPAKWQLQAERTAWRVIWDLVDAQLATVKLGLTAITEVFLPYAQDSQGGTLYERMRATRFAALLPPPKPEAKP